MFVYKTMKITAIFFSLHPRVVMKVNNINVQKEAEAFLDRESN